MKKKIIFSVFIVWPVFVLSIYSWIQTKSIEHRLNNIGIYNYEQVSKLNTENIHKITELIDFFPGRIERDNWVGKAQLFKINT